MAFVLLVFLALFCFFILIPANILATKILSIWLNIDAKEVDSDKYWAFRIFMIGVTYIFLWWLGEITGIRAWLVNVLDM